VSDSNRIPRLKQLARNVVINAENCVLDGGVGRGISPGTQQFIGGGYVFPASASYDYVLEHNRISRLVTAKYGSAVTIRPNVCMSVKAFTCPLP
jgi:hypothetical protein